MLKQVAYLHQLKKYERCLNKHHIQIAHFIPGRIRLKSDLWKQNERLLQELMDVIKSEPYVQSVEYVTITGSMVIEFTLKDNPPIEQIDQWVNLLLSTHAYIRG
ncbi:HMA2 domain-containing protein [Bacillus songklensis]|uniref:HMA2 domain-containing protein n=1 Tax=Bacillus songklensis TaxID=1069116 RepID=A0ABV8AYX8_9BACI